MDLRASTPPEDVGSDTLRRYRYQAKLALPYLISCAQGEEVLSVIFEHFEDLVVEYADSWLLIQVKTRNLERGPWRLSHVLESGGALHHLLNTYRETSSISGLSLALHLEGAIATSDPLNFLTRTSRDVNNHDLKRRVCERLSIDDEEYVGFVDCLEVKANFPSRAETTSRNVMLLGHVSPYATQQELESTHERILDLAMRAMSGERLGDLLFEYISSPDAIEESRTKAVNAKRIVREQAVGALGGISTGPFPLLQRVIAPGLPEPTQLEVKLLMAGASPAVVENAKRLRANAYRAQLRIAASSLVDYEGHVEDVNMRLMTVNSAIVQSQGQERHLTWQKLLEVISNQADAVDPNRIYRRDPFLLLGAVYQLADECAVDWGGRHA